MIMYEKIRKVMTKHIARNQYTIITWIRPTIDNGFGKLIPDLAQSAIETTLGIARISRRRLPDPIITNPSTPYDYLDVYYLLAVYDAIWLKQGIIFEYYGQKFRTLLPENRIINGGIAYKLCALEQVTSTDVENLHGG